MTLLSFSKNFMRECLWTLLAGLATSAVAGLFMVSQGEPFWVDDTQQSFMPVSVEAHRALKEGSLPLISDTSWVAGRLGGDYANGVLSPFNLAVNYVVFGLGLSMRNTASVIMLVYLAVYGAGAFRVGRTYGLAFSNALVVAFSAALNGWMLYWGTRAWIFFAVTGAWLGWSWWGLLIASRPRYGVWRFLPAGVFLFLLFTGAHPQVVLMIALVTAWLVVGRLVAWWRLLRKVGPLAAPGAPSKARSVLAGLAQLVRLWPIAAAWALGLSLAAPALLLFVETLTASIRDDPTILSYFGLTKWAVPPLAFFGAVVPAFQAHWEGWRGWTCRSCFETYDGLVPAVAVLAVLARSRLSFLRRHAWEFVLLAVTMFLSSRGYFGNFRWAFKWLPLFHLVLGLLGGLALQQWLGPEMGTSTVCAKHPKGRSGKRLMSPFPAPTVCAKHPKGRSGKRLMSPFPVLWSAARASLGCPGFMTVAAALGIGTLYLLVIGVVYLVPLWETLERIEFVWGCSAIMFIVCAAWMLGDLFAVGHRGIRNWVAPAVMSAALLVPWSFHRPQDVQYMMTWPLLDDRVLGPGRLDRDRLYFIFFEFEDHASQDADNGLVRRFGNMCMFANVKFVNGYSTMATKATEKFFHMGHNGLLHRPDAEFVCREVGPEGLLSLMGVDGIVLDRSYLYLAKRIEKQGWDVVHSSTKEVLLHRRGPRRSVARSLGEISWAEDIDDVVDQVQNRCSAPAPAVLLSAEWKQRPSVKLARVEVSSVEESRWGVHCRVNNPSSQAGGLILFSRAWYPGFRAFLDGKEVEVHTVNGLQPAVFIPPQGKGELVLRYAPDSFRSGLLIAMLGGSLSVIVPGIVSWRRARTRCS